MTSQTNVDLENGEAVNGEVHGNDQKKKKKRLQSLDTFRGLV